MWRFCEDFVKTKGGILDENSVFGTYNEAEPITVQEWQRRFATTLQYFMKFYSISQRELAWLTNISESAISRYLKCTRIPSAVTIMKLCDVFQEPYETFLDQGGPIVGRQRAIRGVI